MIMRGADRLSPLSRASDPAAGRGAGSAAVRGPGAWAIIDVNAEEAL